MGRVSVVLHVPHSHTNRLFQTRSGVDFSPFMAIAVKTSVQLDGALQDAFEREDKHLNAEDLDVHKDLPGAYLRCHCSFRDLPDDVRNQTYSCRKG